MPISESVKELCLPRQKRESDQRRGSGMRDMPSRSGQNSFSHPPVLRVQLSRTSANDITTSPSTWEILRASPSLYKPRRSPVQQANLMIASPPCRPLRVARTHSRSAACVVVAKTTLDKLHPSSRAFIRAWCLRWMACRKAVTRP